MAGFIAKQPNGLYCRFSSIVDTVTDWNMTFDDYVKLIIKRNSENDCPDNIRKLNAIKEADEIINGGYLKPFEHVLEKFEPRNQSIKDFKEWCLSIGYKGDFKPYEDIWQSIEKDEHIQELADVISSTKSYLDASQDDCYWCPLRRETELSKDGKNKLTLCQVLEYVSKELEEILDE